MGTIRLLRLPRRLDEQPNDAGSAAATAARAVMIMKRQPIITARRKVAALPRLSHRSIRLLSLLCLLVWVANRRMVSRTHPPAALDPSPRRVEIDHQAVLQEDQKTFRY